MDGTGNTGSDTGTKSTRTNTPPRAPAVTTRPIVPAGFFGLEGGTSALLGIILLLVIGAEYWTFFVKKKQ